MYVYLESLCRPRSMVFSTHVQKLCPVRVVLAPLAAYKGWHGEVMVFLK